MHSSQTRIGNPEVNVAVKNNTGCLPRETERQINRDFHCYSFLSVCVYVYIYIYIYALIYTYMCMCV